MYRFIGVAMVPLATPPSLPLLRQAVPAGFQSKLRVVVVPERLFRIGLLFVHRMANGLPESRGLLCPKLRMKLREVGVDAFQHAIEMACSNQLPQAFALGHR